VANAAFAGPDKQTLYITAREGLYRVRMLAKGVDRLGKRIDLNAPGVGRTSAEQTVWIRRRFHNHLFGVIPTAAAIVAISAR
jgi:hypothetical protein